MSLLVMNDERMDGWRRAEARDTKSSKSENFLRITIAYRYCDSDYFFPNCSDAFRLFEDRNKIVGQT
jgi:hypothetical protein